MPGFLALGVAAYCLWKFNKALEGDLDGKALAWLFGGFFVVFILGAIFL